MRKKLSRIFRLALLSITSLSIVWCIGGLGSVAFAQGSSAGEENLSGINWDEEEAAESGTEQDGGDPATMDWGESEDPNIAAEENRAAAQTVEDRKIIEGREFVVHVWGFSLFALYLVGIVYTAYFTRNRKIAVHYAPELLILLHMLWPLQWVCLLFAGQKVK